MTNVFEKPSVERLVTGGTYVLFFGLIAGLLGWLFMTIASRSDIGIGPELLGYITVASALNGIGICISGGFHQALSKYLSEASVESKEKALPYAKAGFFIFTTIGLAFFAIFISISIYLLPKNFEYGLIFGIVAALFFTDFFRDNFIGNIASTHRFDYIGKINFIAGLGNFGLSCLFLFLIPKPLNGILITFTLLTNVVFQIILVIHYGRKALPYPLSSVFKGARRPEIIRVLKYGLYCIIPNIVFSSAILWIQNLWYSGFFSFDDPKVSINGLIIGYASIVFAICQFGWPQIPAVAEAKAMHNFPLIDDYMKGTLHTGFNISAFFLIIYIGLSNHLLFLFHGPEYLIGHIPFVILTVAVAILGIEFLVCSLLIGLGEGRKAASLIAILTLIQIGLVPFLILGFNASFGADSTLYAGPISLLISSLAIFPLLYHYLVKYTKNPSRTYRNILGKGAISIVLTLACYILLELTILTYTTSFLGPTLSSNALLGLLWIYNNPLLGLVMRGIILFGFFAFFMLIFAGLDDNDLDFYEKASGPLKPFLSFARWLLHHSPFYKSERISQDH